MHEFDTLKFTSPCWYKCIKYSDSKSYDAITLFSQCHSCFRGLLQTVICRKVHGMLLYLFYIVRHILILIRCCSSKIPNYPFESIDHFTKTHLRPLIDIKRYPLFVRHNESLRFRVGPSASVGKVPSTSDLVILDIPTDVQSFLPYLTCEKDIYIVHLVYPREDKFAALSYESEVQNLLHQLR
jgi:hypothetical protein